jgi:hypothetical protein
MRCSNATGGIIRLEARGEELFLASRVHYCFCHSAVVFRSWSWYMFITVRSHSFSTDFIYSGFRVQFWSSCTRVYLLSPFGVPYGLNWASSFSFSGVKVVLSLALVCCYQSPQIGCVFVTVISVHSINILSFFPSGSALCASLHGASILSINDALLLLGQFVICAVNFLYFRARYFGVILVFFGGSCSEPTLWDSGAEFLPFCRRVLLICWTILSARNLTVTTLFWIQFCVDFWLLLLFISLWNFIHCSFALFVILLSCDDFELRSSVCLSARMDETRIDDTNQEDGVVDDIAPFWSHFGNPRSQLEGRIVRYCSLLS